MRWVGGWDQQKASKGTIAMWGGWVENGEEGVRTLTEQNSHDLRTFLPPPPPLPTLLETEEVEEVVGCLRDEALREEEEEGIMPSAPPSSSWLQEETEDEVDGGGLVRPRVCFCCGRRCSSSQAAWLTCRRFRVGLAPSCCCSSSSLAAATAPAPLLLLLWGPLPS